MHDEDDNMDLEVNYDKSNKENQSPIPPPVFITNNPNHPYDYPMS